MAICRLRKKIVPQRHPGDLAGFIHSRNGSCAGFVPAAWLCSQKTHKNQAFAPDSSFGEPWVVITAQMAWGSFFLFRDILPV